MAQTKFDRQWFRVRLGERNLSQRGFAKLVGMDPAAISLIVTSSKGRVLSLAEAQLFANALGVPVAQVLTRAGVPIESTHRRVKIVATINGEGLVSYVAKGSEDITHGPLDLPLTAEALQVRAHYSKFSSLDRWIMFVSGVQQDPPQLLGQLVLCGLKDGKEFVAHMRPGYQSGTVNLHLGDTMKENVAVMWAEPVLWLKPYGNHEDATAVVAR